MAKDPAFLFYPADASEDTQFMNRLERGAYFDLVKSQRLFHGYTTEQLRKVLGRDYEEVWPSLDLILKHDESGYFISWVRDSLTSRKEYQQKQKERVEKRWNNRGNTVVLPSVNVNGNKDINNNGALFFELPELEKELINSGEWKGKICRDFKIKMDQCDSYIKEFIKKIDRDGEECKSLRDAKKHFNNWIPSQIGKKELNGTETKRYKDITID